MSYEYESVGTQPSGVSFGLDVLIVHGLVVHGGQREAFS
jgi:hypothetical protein